MKKSMVALCLLLIVAVTAVAQTPAKPSLYKRLGGYDAIAAVSDDFLARLAADKQLSRFLIGRSEDNMKHLRQTFVDQICAVTGGPCIYIGRDMKTTHKGMGITEADWTAAVNDLVATLDKFNVKGDERAELLAAVSSLKKDIVEKP
jgi:hemoglobin